MGLPRLGRGRGRGGRRRASLQMARGQGCSWAPNARAEQPTSRARRQQGPRKSRKAVGGEEEEAALGGDRGPPGTELGHPGAAMGLLGQSHVRGTGTTRPGGGGIDMVLNPRGCKLI